MGRRQKRKCSESSKVNCEPSTSTVRRKKPRCNGTENPVMVKEGDTSHVENGMATFDFTSPKRLFQSLISPTGFDDFFDNFWEKKPMVLHRHDILPSSLKDYFQSLFSKKTLLQILKQHSVHYERDLNVFRYKEKREGLNEKGRVTSGKFEKLYSRDKATVQFHQPQRFQDELWRVIEFLESFFGSLVGSNVYITPGGAQGLPPHYDDVEVFILQLEGEKHWRLYAPMAELPRDYSSDLTQDEIGKPTHDFILKPGDLLYFPRGTIHQAVTPTTISHSTHITISTYQRQSWGDYMMSVFPHLMEEAMKTDIDFRRGLPVNFIKSTKLSKTDKVQSVLGILLQKLVKIRTQKFLAPESMIEDFMKSRLPPFKVDGKSLQETIPEGSLPDLGSKVRLKHPDHVCFLVKHNIPEDSNENDESEEESGLDDSCTSGTSQERFLSHSLLPLRDEEVLCVYSSLYNDRLSHMMGLDFSEEGCGFAMRFPKHYMDAMCQLKSSCDQFTAVKELQLQLDDEKENLIRALWSSHLLEVIPSINGKVVKSTKLD